MTDHPADSSAQRRAERDILDAVSRQLTLPALQPARIVLATGGAVEVDGTTEDNAVVVEAYARHGGLKGGQLKKVAQDILKLVTIEQSLPGVRKILAFADDEAARSISGWVRGIADAHGIEFVVVALPEETRQAVLAAQDRMRTAMVPVDTAADDIVLDE